MKGTFNGKISAQFTAPKTWVLEKPLSFDTRSLGKHEVDLLLRVGANVASHLSKISGRVTCDKGMKTDLASVPRIVWSFISPWDVARAAVIHDHLYASLRQYYNGIYRDKKKWKEARKLSDDVFLWAMQSAEPPVPKYKIWCAYYAVRIFGRWPASAKPDQAEK
jgi:hypothetical protein